MRAVLVCSDSASQAAALPPRADCASGLWVQFCVTQCAPACAARYGTQLVINASGPRAVVRSDRLDHALAGGLFTQYCNQFRVRTRYSKVPVFPKSTLFYPLAGFLPPQNSATGRQPGMPAREALVLGERGDSYCSCFVYLRSPGFARTWRNTHEHMNANRKPKQLTYYAVMLSSHPLSDLAWLSSTHTLSTTYG